MPWAKCPLSWAKIKNRTEGKLDVNQDETSAYLPAEESSIPHPSGQGYLPGLSYLRWGQQKATGTAAIMLMFALVIRSNLDQQEFGQRKDDQVVVTYDQLQDMTLLSREMIAKGLKLLRELGAITATRNGNGCSYQLNGIDKPGWCKLPQAHLLDGKEFLRRLAGMREALKRRSSLDAMKLYVLLLAFRDNSSNVTRISYSVIREYTGMRREEISIAVQLLQGAQLCRLAANEEVPLRSGQHSHNRYIINGLSGS